MTCGAGIRAGWLRDGEDAGIVNGQSSKNGGRCGVRVGRH